MYFRHNHNSSMAPLPFFFLLFLFSSLQIEARQNFFFSKFTYDSVREPQIRVSLDLPTPAPAPAPALPHITAYAPTYSPTSYAPTYAPSAAPAPDITPAEAPEVELFVPAPAPSDSEPEFLYDLYGSTGQETPTTSDVQNEIVTEENGNYANTNLYSYNNDEYATSNYNKDYVNGREVFTNSYYNGDASTFNGVEQQGMSDTRFLENGRYYQDDMKNDESYNDNLNAYYGNSEKPNEFNTKDEYDNVSEQNQTYVP